MCISQCKGFYYCHCFYSCHFYLKHRVLTFAISEWKTWLGNLIYTKNNYLCNPVSVIHFYFHSKWKDMEIQKNLRILTSEVHDCFQCWPSAYLRGRRPVLLLLLVSTVYIPIVANFKLPNYLIINGNIS